MQILKKPHITQKSVSLNKAHKHSFIVDKKANKIEIKKQIAKLFLVTVLDVKTMRYAGKKSTRYTKKAIIKGQRASYKKAIVTLKKGDIIDIHSDIA